MEEALSQMLGVPAKLIQPGSRAAAGGDPMTISLPLTANTGLGAHLTICQCCDDKFTPVTLTADVPVYELCRGSRVLALQVSDPVLCRRQIDAGCEQNRFQNTLA